MRGTIILWAGLAGLYLVFLSWHMSWKPPLTQAEITEALGQMQHSTGRDGVRAEMDALGSGQAMLNFLRSDDGKPFYMLNLIRFREAAEYADGTNPDGLTGAEANAIYARYVLPNLFKRGSYPLLVTDRLTTITDTMSSGEAEFQTVALIRYRSRRDFLDMVSQPAFGEAVANKWAGLDGTLVSPTDMQMAFRPTLLVPLILLIAGGLGSLVQFLGQARRRALPFA